MAMAVSRRELLRIGGLGVAGLGLPDLLSARAATPAHGTFGRAKSCILLFMDGGQPHQDTFDLKPLAPVEIRGEFQPIATNVPGVNISERFPLIAAKADKYAIVRSVHVGSDVHEVGTYAMLTGTEFRGQIIPDSTRETPEDTPSMGSVMAWLRRGSRLPPYVWLPFIWKGFPVIAQGYAGFLGRTFDPFRILEDPNAADFKVQGMVLSDDLSPERFHGRRDLLDSLNQRAEQHFRSPAAANLGSCYQNAFSILASPQAGRAFNLSAEDARVRDRYGRHTFGQSTLLARRLIEQGVALVTVYYNDYREKAANFNNWDTHQKNYPFLKDNLMPSTDLAFSALLEDLSERGLLDETLVVMMGDFGRTPKINAKGGRDHWGGCCSVVFAGAGIRGGQVYGSSDSLAAYPKDQAVRPGDIVATIYHCLGVDHQMRLADPFGRPQPICEGKMIADLLG